MMYLGSLVEVGPTDEVYGNPAHPYTRALIASNPEPDPRRERHRSRGSLRGGIPSAINPPPGCRFVERCPVSMNRCHIDAPQLKPAGHDHRAACHLTGDASAGD